MSEEIIMINKIDETVEETGEFADEFTFDLEELEGDRASVLIVGLDPVGCTINH
ncbi:MAG TPA: hypothetical protein VGF67_33735 [Ktedonobacteraceae bacterium]|jgi:hypothetical protein